MKLHIFLTFQRWNMFLEPRIEVLVMRHIRVKNIFKRPKLRNDFANVATAFSDYMIVGDERPDQTAEAVYGDPRFDWVILTTNNITNYRDQWLLNDVDFQIYILEKYGSEEKLKKFIITTLNYSWIRAED